MRRDALVGRDLIPISRREAAALTLDPYDQLKLILQRPLRPCATTLRRAATFDPIAEEVLQGSSRRLLVLRDVLPGAAFYLAPDDDAVREVDLIERRAALGREIGTG